MKNLMNLETINNYLTKYRYSGDMPIDVYKKYLKQKNYNDLKNLLIEYEIKTNKLSTINTIVITIFSSLIVSMFGFFYKIVTSEFWKNGLSIQNQATMFFGMSLVLITFLLIIILTLIIWLNYKNKIKKKYLIIKQLLNIKEDDNE